MTKKASRFGWDNMTGEFYADPECALQDHVKTHEDGVMEYKDSQHSYLAVHAGSMKEAKVLMAPHILRLGG